MNKTGRVVVIGGGATGTGILRDLAMRGIDCVLVERGDLATGTSGRFHGLLHSGARYAVSDAHSAAECVEENAVVRSIAPFCVEDTGGLFLAVKGDDDAFVEQWREGCRRAKIAAEEIPLEELRREEPLVTREVARAFRVPDAAVDGFTLAWANAASAKALGAQVKTYTRAVGFSIEENVVRGVRLQDVKTGAEELVECAMVINAAGAWAKEIAALAAQDIPVAPDRGVLLVFNHRLSSRVLNRLRPPSDGDIFVPHGSVTIFGTTSRPARGPDDDEVTSDEVRELLALGGALVPGLEAMRIIRAFAGVRPLFLSAGAGEGREATRGFQVLDHREESGIEGLISVVGGKLTTYRLMAKAAVDAVTRRWGVDVPCTTHQVRMERPFEVEGTAGGALLCECERVTDAFLGEAQRCWRRGSLGDLRRLTRLGMGPCQGSFCTVRAAGYAHESLGVSLDETNALLREHLEERWKGTRPVLWGWQARQAELARGIGLGLLELHRMEGDRP